MRLVSLLLSFETMMSYGESNHDILVVGRVPSINATNWQLNVDGDII